MRKAKVFVDDYFAGLLIEKDEGSYSFTYANNYNQNPVSLTLPIQEETYYSKTLFPFFDGLIPEGWMLNLIVKNWKIKFTDRMGLLLACCKDCIGNVRIEKDE